MRVLPRENEDINSEWIHDKARFSYDGLKRQRLDRPYTTLMGDDGNPSLTPVTWKQGFEAVVGLLDRSSILVFVFSVCLYIYLFVLAVARAGSRPTIDFASAALF